MTAHGPNLAHHLFWSVQFYWNIDWLICVAFPASVAGWSGPKYLLSGYLEKVFQTLTQTIVTIPETRVVVGSGEAAQGRLYQS